MARKSRKHLMENRIEKNSHSGKMYLAAGYIRLSVTKGDEPSDSIENQKRIIRAFEVGRDDIILQKFYIDQNVSGVTFERKAFQEMLEDISKGEINCVITKDLSRLGRNAIDTGYYTERLFPSLGIHLISINDNYDSEIKTGDISLHLSIWSTRLMCSILAGRQNHKSAKP